MGDLAMTAWHSALQIIYYFFTVVILVTIAVNIVKGADTGSTTTNAYTSSLQSGREEPIPITLVLLFCGVFIVAIIVGLYLAFRFRECCMKCLKLFIFLDLLLLLLLGSFVLLHLVMSLAGLTVDNFTSFIVVWNFS